MDKSTEGNKVGEFPVEIALQFLDKIKLSYPDKPEVYREFLSIMKNFKAQVIQTDNVFAQVEALFSGKQELITEFHSFISGKMDETEGEGIKYAGTGDTVPANQQAAAVNYMLKVRKRFSTEPSVYSSFLQVLHTVNQSNIMEVLEQVIQLFAEHKDLLSEFINFLPATAQDKAKERVQAAVKNAQNRRHDQLTSALTPIPALTLANEDTSIAQSGVAAGVTPLDFEPSVCAPLLPDLASYLNSVAYPAVPATCTLGNTCGRKRANSNPTANAGPRKKTAPVISSALSVSDDDSTSAPAEGAPTEQPAQLPVPPSSTTAEGLSKSSTAADAGVALVPRSMLQDMERRLRNVEALVVAQASEIAQLKDNSTSDLN